MAGAAVVLAVPGKIEAQFLRQEGIADIVRINFLKRIGPVRVIPYALNNPNLHSVLPVPIARNLTLLRIVLDSTCHHKAAFRTQGMLALDKTVLSYRATVEANEVGKGKSTGFAQLCPSGDWRRSTRRQKCS